jgi:hypothetical protein
MDMRSENAEYVDITKDGVACLERLLKAQVRTPFAPVHRLPEHGHC